MRYPLVLAIAWAALSLGGCSSPTSPESSAPPPKPLVEARVRKADHLAAQGKYKEAAAIYEEQLQLQPQDPALLAAAARVYSMQADLEREPSKAREVNRVARRYAERAEKAGAKDPLTPLLLAEIAPDGTRRETKGQFSSREDVETLIKQGETAFGRHEFTAAVELYQKALALEPDNYMATLFVGDAHFAAGKLEPACEWFRKAIALSPDAETAHRYLADALAQLGRREEAYEEWISALLCEPYRRTTRQHFTRQMRAAAESRGYIIPRFPTLQSKIDGEKINLVVDPEDGLCIMAYNLSALGWRLAEFPKKFPNEKAARRTLAEEIQAINAMLEVAEAADEEAKPQVQKWEPVLAGLRTLKKEGLLEAYVFLERADEALAKDYVGYRAAHREQLRRYVWRYWCGFE